jgi:hypothetical protein
MSLRPTWTKLAIPYLKNKIQVEEGAAVGMAQAEEHLPSKYRAQSPVFKCPVAPKKK